MPNYLPTIGLEIHAELKTRTKMFCDSKNDSDEVRPNVNICPICTAQPGTLPTINREAVKHVLKVGVACGSNLADYSEFDRKNYFYPDIPKGYQISQYKYPLVSGGSLNGVALTRIHLEEDTARSQHGSTGSPQDAGDFSLIDFNRAGLPLMELVTEPVMHDAKTAGNFARELQLLLRYLGASEANMEKGQMRVEANISVAQNVNGKAQKLGTKVEVKNINSFRAVEKAIEYEVKRQIEELEGGGVVVQETRGWDDAKGKTFSQRKKESSHDYRYFPEPDLPKLKLSEVAEFTTEGLKKGLPELP
ncbi:MAG TPA: Asp-tRNA(Asn)/Glu-tRNA(Gln) amidotransferase subunit GatB, partial [Candidatus Paceibacterota bacterium]